MATLHGHPAWRDMHARARTCMPDVRATSRTAWHLRATSMHAMQEAFMRAMREAFMRALREACMHASVHASVLVYAWGWHANPRACVLACMLTHMRILWLEYIVN